MKDLSGNHKCQDCGSFFHQNPLKKPIITFVRKGGIADSCFEIGDLICSINEKKIKNIIEFEEVVDELKWNSKVNFKINRNGKIINKSINLPEYKDQMLDGMVPNIDVELNKKKQITIRGIYRDIGKSGFEPVVNLLQIFA